MSWWTKKPTATESLHNIALACASFERNTIMRMLDEMMKNAGPVEHAVLKTLLVRLVERDEAQRK